MLTFANLGGQGRLGNQMFQFAATYSIAKTIGYNSIFPNHKHSLHNFQIETNKFFTNNKIHYDHLYIENDRDFSFDEKVFSLPKNSALQGYFQSLKYISPWENDIKEMFKFNEFINSKTDQEFHKLNLNNIKKISLHIRRGDYLGIQDVLPVCHTDYYESALSLIQNKINNAVVIVFSDDLQWCKENLDFKNQIFFESDDIFVNMCAMTRCDAHIIANSSFSWWGAWLSPNSECIIRPKQWFGSAGPQVCKFMFPYNWISL